MKKNLLFVLCIVFSMPLFAQRNTNDYVFYLSEIASDDMEESYVYTYNENYQVATIFETPWGTDQTIDTMHYNELNQLVKISTYQHIGDEWRYVYYIDYTYNDRGLRETRTNYNIFDGEPNLGGVYTYTYDDNDNMVYWELDFAGGLYQKGDLTYNANNQVTQEIVFSYASNSNELRTDYIYDENGNMITESVYMWGSSWYLYAEYDYTYDDNGNCITSECHTGSMLAERHEYQYDETSLDVVVYPINPEELWTIYDKANNAPLIDSYYTLDANYQLQYLCDYLYIYEKINDGINENSVKTVICPNPAEDRFMIKDEKVEKVEIYDLTGKMIYSSNVYGEKVVDVSDFVSGIYVVKMDKGDRVDAVKLVVK